MRNHNAHDCNRHFFSQTIFLFVLILLSVLPSLAQESATPTLLRAMRDELARSVKELRLPSLEKPYYIQYALTDQTRYGIKAAFGSLTESKISREKRVSVSLRVGSPAFDNTNFFDPALGFFGSSDDEERFKSRTIPYETDYTSLRRELWLATDAAYKQSAELFAKKQAALKNRVRLDTLPDFTTAPPSASLIDTAVVAAFDVPYFEKLASDLSAIFREFPVITLSGVSVEYLPTREFLVTTEGREYIRTDLAAGIEIVATAQAVDGMPVAEVVSAYAKTPSGLPSRDSLVKAVRKMAQKLSKATTAPLMQAYSGPVLFEDQAAAEVFLQIFAPNLATQRSPVTERGVSDNPQNAAFQNKIGARVLPEFLSVTSLPTAQNLSATQLFGAYRIDDEGTLAENFTIVKSGYLKGLLSSRTPTRRVKISNGSNRGGAAMFGVLEVLATKDRTLPFKKLRERMMQLCKDRELPYGVIVRKVLNSNILMTTLYNLTEGDFPFARNPGQISTLETYRVYADGREELVRGCDVAGITTQSFKEILAVGDKKLVYNCYAMPVTPSFFSGGAQFLPATAIVPALLFEDVEVRPIEDDFTKPPVLTHPFFSRKQ
jgi:TldD protein